MALITCPECGKEISDKAESCPSCGYVLVKNELPKIRRSELSQPEKATVSGIVFILCGTAALIFGIFTIAIIIGIFAIIGGVGLIGMGAQKMAGQQKGDCPYCKHEVVVAANSKTFKCPHCKKTSTHSGSCLEAIE